MRRPETRKTRQKNGFEQETLLLLQWYDFAIICYEFVENRSEYIIIIIIVLLGPAR